MRRIGRALLLAPALAGILLAGCSKSGGESSAASGTAAESKEEGAVQIGQIRSISGQILTVYLPASAVPAGNGSADAASESGGDGTTADASPVADPAGGTGSAAGEAAGDSAGDGEAQAAVDGIAQGFAAETIDIAVGDATVLTKSAALGAEGGDDGAVATDAAGSTAGSGVNTDSAGAAIDVGQAVDSSSARDASASSAGSPGDGAAASPAAGEPTAENGTAPVDASVFDSDAIALSDLAPGDFIAYTLTSGSNVAARIALLPGNPYEVNATDGGAAAPAPQGSATPPASADASGAPTSGGAKPGGAPKSGGAPQVSGAPSADKPSGSGANPAAQSPRGGRAEAAKPSSSASSGASAGASATASAAPAGAADKASPADKVPADATGQMTIGKIKSISGNTITIYKASTTPGAGGNDASPGTPPSGGPSGTPPASGEPEAAAKPSGEAGGNPGGGPRGGRMAQTFTDETMDIEVTDATSIVSVTLADGKRTETTIALSSLKAGDIIMIRLKEGTSQAVSIRLDDGGGVSASANE